MSLETFLVRALAFTNFRSTSSRLFVMVKSQFVLLLVTLHSAVSVDEIGMNYLAPLAIKDVMHEHYSRHSKIVDLLGRRKWEM